MDICRYVGHCMQELWNQGRASPCEEAQSHGKRLSCTARVQTSVQRGGMHGFSHLGFAGFLQFCVGLEARGLGW